MFTREFKFAVAFIVIVGLLIGVMFQNMILQKELFPMKPIAYPTNVTLTMTPTVTATPSATPALLKGGVRVTTPVVTEGLPK